MTPHNPFPPGSLVAAYFRDSGGDAQELSIPQQQASFLAWCTANHLTPGQTFTDASRPGASTVGREAFHNMIHHFHTVAPEAGLVIWSYSRFARDFDDAQFYRADLRRRGYLFHSLNDDIPEGAIGRLFEAAIDWKNETFLEDLSRDVKRGLAALVATHGCVPGCPPRGFLRQPVSIGKRRDGQDHLAHRWVPDPALAPLVVQAFAMRASGASLTQVHTATHLYSSLNSYTTFYRNRLYIGILDYGGQSIPYCDPIVDPQTWQAVQERVKHNESHTHPRRMSSRYLLSGLAFCARCGAPLYGETSPQRSSRTYDRYGCTRAHRRRDCDLQLVPRQTLEQSVLSTLTEYILSPEVQQYNQTYLIDSQERIRHELNDQQSALRSQLRTNQKKIANLTRAIEDAGHSPAMLDRLSTLEGEASLITAQLAAFERQLSAVCAQTTPDLDELRTTLLTANHSALQAILRGIIQKIIVDRQGSKILGEIIYFHPP